MADAVRIVAAERVALAVVAVRIDIVGDDLLQTVFFAVKKAPGFTAAIAAFCAPRTMS